MKTASVGRRTLAFTIDIVLLAVTWPFLFFLLAACLFRMISLQEPLAMIVFFAAFLIVFLASLAFVHMSYCTLMHAWLGQTIGKIIMGIRVVTEDNRLATVGVAFMR